MDTLPVNPETLESLKEYADPGEPGFLDDLIASYLIDTEARLAGAWEAQRSGDAAALARLAHTIKGGSLNVGAETLAALMQKLERECKAGLLPGTERLRSAEAEFKRVREALSAWHG